ncbi:MAG: flagellar basal body rod protein FlgB [Thermoleophilia bacterium]|jgi:flagellar basal-body rod protein FlgB|nr:flagellar basal body rod protein FlgB [Thermoleophilia bacterium]
MFPFDVTTSALSSALRGLSARHTALAQNVANADTPAYRRVDVQFEDALAEAIAQDRGTDGGAGLDGPASLGSTAFTDAVEPELGTEQATVMRVDGGNVDPDREMAELSANQLQYQAVTTLLAKRLEGLSSVIAGR